jgi:hypothetical protein
VDELMHEMDGNLNKLNFHFGKDPATILPKWTLLSLYKKHNTCIEKIGLSLL